MGTIKNRIRSLLHRFIAWYLGRNGAFHVYPYGPEGRYAVLMTEPEYHLWCEQNGRWITVNETAWAKYREPPFEILVGGKRAIVLDVDHENNRLLIKELAW